MKFDFMIDLDRVSGNPAEIVAQAMHRAAEKIDANRETELIIHNGVHIGSWAFKEALNFGQRFDPSDVDSEYAKLLCKLEGVLDEDHEVPGGKERRAPEAIMSSTMATLVASLGYALSQPETFTYPDLVGQAWEFACARAGDHCMDLFTTDEALPRDVRVKWAAWVIEWRRQTGQDDRSLGQDAAVAALHDGRGW